MRSLTTYVMLAVVAGCAAPRIAVESVVARAAKNEIAAARSTNGMDVLATGPHARVARYVYRAQTDGGANPFPLQVGVLGPSHKKMVGVLLQFRQASPEADAFESEMMASLTGSRRS